MITRIVIPIACGARWSVRIRQWRALEGPTQEVLPPGTSARRAGTARAQWLERRRAELLPAVEYFHVAFTLPESIVALAYQNKKTLYDLLFRTSAETLRTIAADPRHLGAELGFITVLHTWGQNLLRHLTRAMCTDRDQHHPRARWSSPMRPTRTRSCFSVVAPSQCRETLDSLPIDVRIPAAFAQRARTTAGSRRAPTVRRASQITATIIQCP
ncbi:hypothetical protein OKW28_004453 [Paraburkholderia sp. 40]